MLRIKDTRAKVHKYKSNIAGMYRGFVSGIEFKQEIFRFDVGMYGAVGVDEGDGLQDLPEQVGGLLFGEGADVEDPLEQVAAAHALHHDVAALGVLQELEVLDDVRVVCSEGPMQAAAPESGQPG